MIFRDFFCNNQHCWNNNTSLCVIKFYFYKVNFQRGVEKSCRGLFSWFGITLIYLFMYFIICNYFNIWLYFILGKLFMYLTECWWYWEKFELTDIWTSLSVIFKQLLNVFLKFYNKFSNQRVVIENIFLVFHFKRKGFNLLHVR